jgi:EamA domain-containing membrane protein RarD
MSYPDPQSRDPQDKAPVDPNFDLEQSAGNPTEPLIQEIVGKLNFLSTPAKVVIGIAAALIGLSVIRSVLSVITGALSLSLLLAISYGVYRYLRSNQSSAN